MSLQADTGPDLVAACLRKPVSRTPVWFMRQAGRSLPEYRAARGEGSILSAIEDAALSAELTLQPVRRYGVDAAILFSDIVVPLHAIGFGITIEPGRGPVVAEPFRQRGRPAPAAPLRARGRRRPTSPPRSSWSATSWPGAVSRSSASPGAPFTVASYLVEGGPSRTFAKVKALMHGDPALWAQLAERLAAMAVASLRAQIRAGAQAVQLFDSWAGSLAPDEYARFALPATRAVLEGIADLGVPTILFGVGTGELLGLMGSAGPDVVGVDWRVPLAEARRRVGDAHALQGNLDPALCLAPWPVVEQATRTVLASAADGSGTGHVFNLGHGVLPEIRPGRPGRGRRPGAPGDRDGMTVGVLVMAHGTPASTEEIEAFYTRIRRGRPPEPAQLAELAGRYQAIGGTSPLAARTRAQVDALRRALETPGAGPLPSSPSGPSTPIRCSRTRRAELAASGVETVIGLVLTPHASSMGSRRVPRAGGRRAGNDPVHRHRVVVRRAGVRSAAGGARHAPRWTASPGAPAWSSPPTPSPNGCGREVTPTPSNSRSRPAWSPPRPAWTRGRWPGRARAAHPSRGSVPTSATRCAGWPPRGRPTPWWCARSASWPTTSRCSTTSTSSWRAWPPRWVSPTHARRRSTTIPPSSMSWPTS